MGVNYNSRTPGLTYVVYTLAAPNAPRYLHNWGDYKFELDFIGVVASEISFHSCPRAVKDTP